MPWNIAERVEQCRKEKGWTRSELSRRARLNPTHLWKILDGQRPRVEAETVRRLARAFGVTTDYLLGMDLADDDEPAAARGGVRQRSSPDAPNTPAPPPQATVKPPRPRKAASAG